MKQVIRLQLNPKDIHQVPIFPQPAFPPVDSSDSVLNMENPAVWSLGGVRFAAVTNDPVFALNVMEKHRYG